MLFVTALFGGLMLLSVESRRRMIAVLLIGCIAILGISPPPAQAQLPFCLPCVIQTVLTTITVTIGGWLTQDQRRTGKDLLALQADRVAARKDQPGEVANPVDHHAVSWRDPVDHVDQPSHRHAAESCRT